MNLVLGDAVLIDAIGQSDPTIENWFSEISKSLRVFVNKDQGALIPNGFQTLRDEAFENFQARNVRERPADVDRVIGEISKRDRHLVIFNLI